MAATTIASKNQDGLSQKDEEDEVVTTPRVKAEKRHSLRKVRSGM